MSTTPTASERAEFRAFCEGSSDNQVREIKRKEEAAGRSIYAEIAAAELRRRGLSE